MFSAAIVEGKKESPKVDGIFLKRTELPVYSETPTIKKRCFKSMNHLVNSLNQVFDHNWNNFSFMVFSFQ